jgi:polyisoprenoid-binding protein YceI
MSLAALAFALALSSNAPAQVLDGAGSTAEFEEHLRLPMRGVGRFARISGELSGEPAQGWKVALHIDGRSLHFDGPGWMDAITRSRAFLDVNDFPNIELRTGAIPDDVLHRGGQVRGELTLRGVTRPATFLLQAPTCARPGAECDLVVQGTVSRRAFGMTGYRMTLRDGVDVRVRLRWRMEPGR